MPCASTCACARARAAVVRERWRRGRRGSGPARSLSSARPRTRAAALGGSRRTSALVPLSLSSVHSRCRLTRAAAARGCPSFPTGRLVPFRFSRGWCASVPPSGEGERPASASRRGSRTEPAPCEACLVAAAFPPSAFPPPTPVRVPSYRVPARRFKDPGGVASPSPGSGGRRGPQGAVAAAPSDSRSRGGTPPSRGSGSPPWAPVGLASACPVRRCVVGRGPRVCRSRPAS